MFTSLTGMSLIVISSSALGMRMRAAIKDDLPALVRPAIPIFAPPLVLRFIFFSTRDPQDSMSMIHLWMWSFLAVANVREEVVTFCTQARSQAWCKRWLVYISYNFLSEMFFLQNIWYRKQVIAQQELKEMFRLLKKTTKSKKKIDLRDLKYWITTTDWIT